ncbi:MAG: hypothetical protein KDB13_05930 [Microthrixaceae bacterium]|jgi:hypothetical protein|nr:hypothetical protein [Microthrixaceae bacterium]MCB0987081.1 hypothetical protein [Acidimicrobiales bacterium]
MPARSTAIHILVLGTVTAVASSIQVATRESIGLVTWAWMLTTWQLLAIWLLSRDRAVGWLIGSVVQASWAVYGALTSQPAFIAGCCVSLIIQGKAWLRPRLDREATDQ